MAEKDKPWNKNAVRSITVGDRAIVLEVIGPPGREAIAVKLMDTSLAGNPQLLVEGSLGRAEIEADESGTAAKAISG